MAHRTAVGPDDIALLEFPPVTEAEEMARAILAQEPDVVGLSCYIWNDAALMA